MVAASRSIAECQRDDETTRPGDDAVDTRGKKRTSFDTERHSNKCFRGDVATLDDDVAAADDDDGTARCDVFSNADDAQTERTCNDARTPTPLTAEVNTIPIDLCPANPLRYSESPTSVVVSLSSNIYKTADNVMMTPSKLALPVVSSTSYSEGPYSSESHCPNIANTATTYCNVRDTDDITLTSSKLLPVVSLTTKTVCRGTTTFVSSATSPLGTVGLFPRAPTPTRVGCVLHSAAGLFPFPVPMTISQQAPFVVGCSTMTMRPSAVPLGTPRWLPVAHATRGPQYPPLRLVSSPTVTGYFRKQHATGCYGPGSPQIRYGVATSGDCAGLSDLVLRPNSAEVAPRVREASQPPRLLPRSSSVDPPQRAPTCESPQQAFVDRKPTADSEDVIAKLDPVSRAVYDNFLGKLRTTTRPKTITGRRKRHANDVTRRYRN